MVNPAIFPALRRGPSGSPAVVSSPSGIVNVTDYGASNQGIGNPEAAFAEAAQAALALGAALYAPGGTYGDGSDWNFDLPSGLTFFGDGDSTVLLNCYITAIGSALSEIPFSAAAAKGATSIDLTSTAGIVAGDWLRVASIINSQSTDAGVEQLGHLPLEYSSFAEFVQVSTVLVGTVGIYSPLFFPYSNTPGSQSDPAYPNQTSVARVMRFHQSGRLADFKMLGRSLIRDNCIRARFCRDLVIENVTVDCNDMTTQNVVFDYCMDCKMVWGKVVGKQTSVPPGSTADPICIFSSQRVRIHGTKIQNGRQGIFISYRNNDATYRGGPSLVCGAESCDAFDCDLDAFTSVWGCYGSFFQNCTNWGSPVGFRMRDRACQVIGCRSISSDLVNGVGVIVDQAAVIDAQIADNRIVGHLQGVELSMTIAGYEALQALLGASGANVVDNVITNCGDHGVYCNIAFAQATLVGPRIVGNQIANVVDDGIQVNSYWNGTLIDRNRIMGTLATMACIRYQANIRRLAIGTNIFLGMNATATGIVGAGIGSFITNLAVFPAGEAEAQLFIGPQIEDAAAGQKFGGVIRNAIDWYQLALAGWQPFTAGLGTANPTLTRSMMAAWLDGDGLLRWRSLNGDATIDRQYGLVIRGSGSPEGVVSASVGVLYASTTGGAGTTLYVKETGTGNTGWVAK